MEFKRLTLDCVKTLEPFFKDDNPCRICDYTRGGTLMWRDYHKTEYSITDGVLYMKVAHPETAFAPPRGTGADGSSGACAGVGSGDDAKAYECIREFCRSEGIPALLCCISKSTLGGILKMYPNSKVWTDRAWSDYLYLSEDIINLAGRRYSGQRNHINRFMREHPDWSFRQVGEDNIDAAMVFIGKLALRNENATYSFIEANRKALEALDNLELYNQLCGALYADGAIVGISLGETQGDTLFIHVEKADTQCHGSYPMLMNQFARMFATEAIRYINREEDDGIEGLRTSKLSYHPVELLEKYMVELR